jgi:hypothetical protein
MNQKFDVKNYRIVENKQLLKEAVDPISIIVALIAFLVGAFAGASASYGRLYGEEKGKQAAEKVKDLKKTLEEAIDALEKDEDKTAAKAKVKEIFNKYPEMFKSKTFVPCKLTYF